MSIPGGGPGLVGREGGGGGESEPSPLPTSGRRRKRRRKRTRASHGAERERQTEQAAAPCEDGPNQPAQRRTKNGADKC